MPELQEPWAKNDKDRVQEAPNDYTGKFRHKESGRIYVLLAISNRAATRPGWPVTAVYVDTEGEIWTRPFEEFVEACEEVTGNGG